VRQIGYDSRIASARTAHAPLASPVFVGRAEERERLLRMLAVVRVALVYGVPGVGKTALALSAAQGWQGPVMLYKAAVGPVSVLADDLRRRLAHGPVREAESDEERLLALAERLDAESALCVIDDLHRLEPSARATLVRCFAERLREGRVIATSRELVPVTPDGPDRFELRLSALDADDARALWARLDELYGPSGSFEIGFQSARGNPLLLRRAHAFAPEGEDPIAATMRTLPSDERQAALALALAELRLPVRVVESLGPGGPAALRRLVSRLVVDVDGAGTCALHDLYRDAMLATSPQEAREPVHLALAGALADLELDPIVKAREIGRHLRAAGRFDEAAAHLAAHGAEYIRHGAAGELLRLIDALPPEGRGAGIEVLRARTLGRLGHIGRAYDELERLLAAGAEPSIDLKLAFGQIATLTGSLAAGERAVREVLDADDLSATQRLRAETALALLLTHRGRGDEARAFLSAARAGEGGPLHASHLRFCHAFTLWLDGRADEAEDTMRAAYAFFRDLDPGFRAGVLAPLFFATLMAGLGRFAEADEALALADASIASSEDLRTRHELRGVRAYCLAENGDRLGGVAEIRVALDAYVRSGHVMARFVMEPLLARVLFRLGRRRDALALLADVRARAEERGALSIVAMAERALDEDPIRRARDTEASAKDDNVFAIYRAAASDVAKGRARVAAARERCAGESFPLERAVLALAALELERPADPSAAVEAVAEAAAREGVDRDLVPALWHALEAVRVLAAEVSGPRSRRDPIVIDRERHEVRAGATLVRLGRRRTLRRLLYALASRPGEPLPREELCAAIWDVAYHPLVHDNALAVNVARLRSLLATTGLAIEADGDGYRLLL
jgi:DNA-binding response OmpR family regulator